MQNSHVSLLALVLGSSLAAGLAGCGGSTASVVPRNSPTPSGAVYKQIELLARPAVKEALEPFADHDATNRSSPYADSTLKNDILTFMEGTAGRSAAISTAVQGVLYPNELAVDLSQPAPAAYLGVETGGATGGKFGGRGLTDDAISIDLSAVFGNVIPSLVSSIPDDGKENNCLITDNVKSGQGGTQTQSSFPYLATPH